MRHVSSIRIAVAGSALALVATAMPSVVGFYTTLVAAAVLLGAGSMAYITAVDRPSALAATDLVACAVVAMLLLADASVRFPSVMSSQAPSASRALAELALILAAAGAVLPAVTWAWRWASGRLGYRGGSGVGAALQRSAKRWRRLIDTAF